MPAEVETLMYAREVPWHGFGTKVDGLQTAKDAIVAAGLDWKVLLRPLYIRDLNAGSKIVKITDGHVATVRDTDSRPLGIVGASYRPVQNVEAFGMADAIVETGEAKYETAGALRNGRIVFLSMEIPKTVKIPGDDGVIQPYLLLTNSHDGSSALRALITTVRVVCSNTLNLALNGKNKGEIKLRHTTNIMDRVSEAQRALGLTFEYLDGFERMANQMMLRKLTDQEVYWAILTAFPIKDVHPLGTSVRDMAKALSDNEGSPAAKAFRMYQTSDNIANVRDTAWGLFNGIAEYLDYGQFYRAREGSTALDSRARSILLNGAAASKKAQVGSMLAALAN